MTSPLDEGLLAAYSDGFVILNDRKVRGVPVDRIVIGPSGVWVINEGSTDDDAEAVDMLAGWVGDTIADAVIVRRFSVQPVLGTPGVTYDPESEGVPRVDPKMLSRQLILRRDRELTNAEVISIARLLRETLDPPA